MFEIKKNEEKRVYELYKDGTLLHTCFFGSGQCTEITELNNVPESVYDEFEGKLDELVNLARKELFLLPPDVVAAVDEYRKVYAHLRELSGKISAGLMETVPEYDPESFMYNPVEELTDQCVVFGVEKTDSRGRVYLEVDGKSSTVRGVATKEADDTYVAQQAGYCEDDFYGEQFFRIRKGENGEPDQFLRISYEC